MNTKKLLTTLAIATITIASTFAVSSAFDTSTINTPDSKNIILTSNIPETDISVKLQYNSSNLTAASITGFDIRQTQMTKRFDVVFTSRLNVTKNFTIAIDFAPFEQIINGENNPTSSEVTPYIVLARDDTSASVPNLNTYTSFANNIFSTSLFAGLNSGVSGANFNLKWVGNPYVASGLWTSTNHILVTAL
ncbi:MAG: hypothetical protein JJE21_05215 [Spirochaetaceae bacterium]|nr:hypothetical protein [Spirochaetaceae bacterium]